MNYDYAKDAILEGLITRSFEIEERDAPQFVFEQAFEGVGSALPIFDEEDHDIVLHREAHFAGSFPLMIQAYEEEAKSAVLDIAPKRIKQLYSLEQKIHKNIAPLILHASDAKKIQVVRKMYRLLRETTSPIAEIILSEDESEEIARKTALLKTTPLDDTLETALLTLLQNELFFDPLFPGYGKAPIACALALGLLGAKNAIPTLFSHIHSDDFDIEGACLRALRQIGEDAKKFCIECLHARPLTHDNEKAAIAITSFLPDDEVIQAVLKEVQDPQVYKNEPLISYLLACLEELPEKFHDTAEKLAIPEKIKNELLKQISSQKKRFLLSEKRKPQS